MATRWQLGGVAIRMMRGAFYNSPYNLFWEMIEMATQQEDEKEKQKTEKEKQQTAKDQGAAHRDKGDAEKEKKK